MVAAAPTLCPALAVLSLAGTNPATSSSRTLSVSRQHARLDLSSVLTVTDLGSANGTSVGGRSLQNASCELPPGTGATLGAALLLVDGEPAGSIARLGHAPKAPTLVDLGAGVLRRMRQGHEMN